MSTDRIRKSVSVENTFDADLPDLASCKAALVKLLPKLAKRLAKVEDYVIKKQFVKLKFNDFVITTVEMLSPETDVENFLTLCEQGFSRGDRPVRLLGVGVRVEPLETELDHSGAQLPLALSSSEEQESES